MFWQGNYSTTVSTLLSVSTSSTISSVYAGVCTCNLGLYKQADGNTSVWRQAGRYRRHRQMDSQADTQTVETEGQTCRQKKTWQKYRCMGTGRHWQHRQAVKQTQTVQTEGQTCRETVSNGHTERQNGIGQKYRHIEHFHVTSVPPCWKAKTIHFLSPGK